MKRILVLWILLISAIAFGQFTDFYVDSAVGSSNIYSGSTTSTTPTYITLSGDWDGTSVFTPNDGSTPANSVGGGTNAWAAISFTSFPTNAVYLGTVDTVAAGANGAITLSTVSKAGSAPASSAGAHTITLVVGGVWAGPNTNYNVARTISFPFNFAAATMTNESSLTVPRVWFKSTGLYYFTNGLTHTLNGPIRFQGYTTTIDDSGRATLDGTSVYGNFIGLSISGNNIDVANFIFDHNGASAAQSLVAGVGTGIRFFRCSFSNGRKAGLDGAAAAIECEAFNNNLSNTPSQGGIVSVTYLSRCLSYSNLTANSFGISVGSSSSANNCISAFNGKSGFVAGASGPSVMKNCDSYSNALHGIEVSGAGSVFVENCNIFKNGGASITNSGATTQARSMFIQNCLFGTGSVTNFGGNFWVIPGSATNAIAESSALPWNAPDTGDFRITSTSAKAMGRGAFVLSSGWSGTTSFPDIGAAQSASTNATVSGGGSWTFAQ